MRCATHALIALLLFAGHADAVFAQADPQVARLREQLRQTISELRQFQAENGQLKADLEKARQEADAATAAGNAAADLFGVPTTTAGVDVAGTIGGVGGNGVGVAGVCWNVKLMGAKFLGSRGGTTANAIKSVDYFTNLKIKGVPVVATNNSWGGGGFSQALQDAISRANAADILFIAAAGNSGANNDATAAYPSGYNVANVIAVAALQSDGALASYSQYGATTVDLGAPGSAIQSTLPIAGKGKNASVTSGYGSYSGTSMATPHVTGAAALYKAINPGATAAQIKAALLNGTPTPSLQGKTLTGDRLDVSGF